MNTQYVWAVCFYSRSTVIRQDRTIGWTAVRQVQQDIVLARKLSMILCVSLGLLELLAASI